MVAGGAVQASALLFTALSEESSAAGQFAEEALPAAGALALAVGVGAHAAVLALAFVAAVVAVTLGGALTLTVVTNITGEAGASAVDGVAEGVVLARADVTAADAEGVGRARSSAGVAVPPGLARALTSPWMTQLSGVGEARADLSAARSVEFVRADPLAAVGARPAFLAGTGAVGYVAHRIVLALTLILAVFAVDPRWALFLTLVSPIAG